MYSTVTHDIKVTVEPAFLADQSDPPNNRFLWSYKVEIENLGGRAVQLLGRHWIITDAIGRREEVQGPGVVGEQPILQPGDSFEYVSGCPLATASGIMCGEYHMVNDKGEAFAIAIPAFSLDSPHERQSVN